MSGKWNGWLYLGLIFGSSTGFCSEHQWMSRVFVPLDEPSINRSDHLQWGVVPSVFLTPELGFGVVGTLFGVSPFKEKTSITTSTSFVLVSGFLASNESYGFRFKGQSIPWNAPFQLRYETKVTKLSHYYWGIGYKNGHDDRHRKIHYGTEYYASPNIAIPFHDHGQIIGGIHAIWLRSQGYQSKDRRLSVAQPNQKTLSVILGLNWDSRDVPSEPKSGHVFAIEWATSRQAFGSDQDFDRWTANLKKYHFFDRDNVFAWSLLAESSRGDVPWYELSLFGGQESIRGYYSGRYRDKTQLSGQIEWRHRFNQRHGMVIWTGVGAVSPSVSQLSSAHWLPMIGVGYRLTLKPRVNMRFDFGLGQSSTGFYIKLNEAF